MNRTVASRRWQCAWWATNFLGAVIFYVCASDLPTGRYLAAWFIAWLSGFLAAGLVEIATR